MVSRQVETVPTLFSGDVRTPLPFLVREQDDGLNPEGELPRLPKW